MHRHALAAGIAALGLLPVVSCGSTGSAPAGVSTRYEGGVSELEVQGLVMQMADGYDAALGETIYLVLRRGELDSTGRWLALSFLRNGMGAAVDIAAGPNPDVALLDLLVLGALQTWAFEQHWIPAGIDAQAGAAAVARLHEAEASLWDDARRVLSEEQERTLRGLIETWIAEHPDQTVVSFVRFDDFTEQRELSTAGSHGRAAGLLRDVGEASAAVEDARLFGERAMWFAGRYPYILGQQAELTTYRILDQPEVHEARASLAAVASAGEDLAARIEELDLRLEGLLVDVREERLRAIEQASDVLGARITEALDGLALRAEAVRSAAVDHVFTRVEAERDVLLGALAEARGELGGALSEAGATADASAAGLVDALFWRGAGLVALLVAGLALVRRIPPRGA